MEDKPCIVLRIGCVYSGTSAAAMLCPEDSEAMLLYASMVSDAVRHTFI